MPKKTDYNYSYQKYYLPIGRYNKGHVKGICEAYFGLFFVSVERNDALHQFDIHIKRFIINEKGNRVLIDKTELDIFKKKFECLKWIVQD